MQPGLIEPGSKLPLLEMGYYRIMDHGTCTVAGSSGCSIWQVDDVIFLGNLREKKEKLLCLQAASVHTGMGRAGQGRLRHDIWLVLWYHITDLYYSSSHTE